MKKKNPNAVLGLLCSGFLGIRKSSNKLRIGTAALIRVGTVGLKTARNTRNQRDYVPEGTCRLEEIYQFPILVQA